MINGVLKGLDIISKALKVDNRFENRKELLYGQKSNRIPIYNFALTRCMKIAHQDPHIYDLFAKLVLLYIGKL